MKIDVVKHGTSDGKEQCDDRTIYVHLCSDLTFEVFKHVERLTVFPSMSTIDGQPGVEASQDKDESGDDGDEVGGLDLPTVGRGVDVIGSPHRHGCHVAMLGATAYVSGREGGIIGDSNHESRTTRTTMSLDWPHA